jgi:hypothetical protein
MFIPELALGLCRMVLDILEKYRAVDMSSRPQNHTPTFVEDRPVKTFAEDRIVYIKNLKRIGKSDGSDRERKTDTVH